MKKELWILLCFMPFVTSAQKNVFQWQPTRYDAPPALAVELEHWEIFQIHPEEMSRLARQHPQGVDMTWQWGNEELAFHLFADDIRGNRYRSAELGSGGVRELPAGPNTTYGGRVAGGGNMRLSLHNNFIFGYWEKGGHTWFVQPLRHFDPAAPEHYFVVYKTSDVKPAPNARCGWTHAESHRKQRLEDAQHAKAARRCHEVEIAIASDFLMVQHFGTVAAVQDFTLGVLNAVQTSYTGDFDHEIRFVIVANVVSSCSGCDPWTSSTTAGELLVSFRAWGNGGGFGISFDVASLWTNRDLSGETVGLAWIGTLCGGSRYSILQRYTPNASLLRQLQMHELGHVFNAQHDFEGSPTVMAPNLLGNFNWSSVSLDAINHYISLIAAQGNCFFDCLAQPLPPTAQIELPVVHVCPGSMVPLIDRSTQSPATWHWNLPGASPSSSALQGPTVRYDHPGIYPVALAVANAAGSDTLPLGVNIVVDHGGKKFLLYETFENQMLLWDVLNPDNGIGWEIREVGGSPYGNKAACINSANYSGAGQVDGIISPSFSLSGAGHPMLRIDYAYRRRNTSGSEQLRIKVSTDGGATFPHTILTAQENGSGIFATGGLTGNAFTPASASDWCYTGNPGSATCIELDLSPFVGNDQVRILIESINAGNNNLYVDNVRVEVDCPPLLPPVAAVEAQPVSGCAPLTVSFQDNSSGILDYRSWSFPGGTPAASSHPSPTVIYQQPGTYTATLIVANAADSDTISRSITIGGSPLAAFDFDYVTGQNTATFSNQSSQADSIRWIVAGQTSANDQVVFEFPGDGVYTARLIAYNHCGNDTATQTITIVTPPAAGFHFDKGAGCAPAEVVFENQSTANATVFTWSFPGGTPAASSHPSPTVIYQQPGTYTATLIVANAAGSDTISRSITIGGPPLAAFDFDYVIGQNTTTFSNQSSQADSIRWIVAGQTSANDQVVFEFPGDGAYTARLIAYNHCGNDTATQTITIVTPPAAGFHFDKGAGCAPVEVVFENQSTANATVFTWSFPGGTPAASSHPSPTVIYQQPGTYTATLIVANAAGSDTISRSMVLESLPVGTFSTEVSGAQVDMTAESPNAMVLNWNFGDGNESTDAGPTHTYVSDGVYVIALTLGNACGQITLTDTVNIYTALPEAGFSAVAREGCAPMAVIFINESSAHAETFAWQFPGGLPESSPEVSPTVIYEQPGIYSVSLTAGNSNGHSAVTRMDYVVVRGLPTAGFSFQMMEAEVAFQTTATQEPGTSYHWDFGDGSTSELPAPTHTYSTGGNYTVSLELSNECGRTVSEMAVNIIINHTGEAFPENGWRVYPNPASGRIVVSSNRIGAGEPLEWVLRDVLGHTLRRVRLDVAGGQLRQVIDLGGLPSGVYVWSIAGMSTGGISGTGKLVVIQ